MTWVTSKPVQTKLAIVVFAETCRKSFLINGLIVSNISRSEHAEHQGKKCCQCRPSIEFPYRYSNPTERGSVSIPPRVHDRSLICTFSVEKVFAGNLLTNGPFLVLSYWVFYAYSSPYALRLLWFALFPRLSP